MTEYKVDYESELDSFQLYYRYEDKEPKDDWRTAALRGPALPTLGNALAGAVGAAISNVATYPLSLIVARLQTQRQRRAQKQKPTEGDKDGEEAEEEEEYTSIFDAFRKIYSQEGLGSLYNGLAQDTFKTVADSFLFFLAYESFRQRRITARFGPSRRGRKRVVLPVLDELVIGVLAGAFAKLFTTPLANIVTRKQTSSSSKKPLSTKDIAAQIKAEKGLRGFWSGYSATLILTLNPSITFFLNEMLKYTVVPREKRGRTSPATTFLLAALSKAAASSVTYPISMAKTRAQAMPSSDNENNNETKALKSIPFTPKIISAVFAIAQTEGIPALYAGLTGEVLKGFFSHGFTMLAKDAVYAFIVKSYYLLLMALRKYPTPEELIERAREQAEEYAEAAREGAKDLVEKTKAGTEEVLEHHSGNVAVDMTSNAEPVSHGHGIESSSGLHVPREPPLEEMNETAELVGDYVEDEAAEWRSLYHWFWEKDIKH